MHQHGESVGVRVMPELRQDRFTKEWVFVASEDIKHPHELIVRRTHKPAPSFDPNCPFCPGHENRTALEILRVPSLRAAGHSELFPASSTAWLASNWRVILQAQSKDSASTNSSSKRQIIRSRLLCCRRRSC